MSDTATVNLTLVAPSERKALRQKPAVRWVHTVIGRDKVERFYFRKKGCPRVALPGKYQSPEFMRVWNACVTGAPLDAPLGVAIERDPRGTVGRAVADYLESADWQALKASSRETYTPIYALIRAEYGKSALTAWTVAHARKALDKLAATPGKANKFLAKMRELFALAIESDLVESNPFDPLCKIAPKEKGGHRTWMPDHIAAFEKRWAIGTRERLAFALLLWTAARRTDMLTFTHGSIKDGVLRYVPEKTRTKTGVAVNAPLLSALVAVLDGTFNDGNVATLANDTRPLVLTRFGRAFSENAFNTFFSAAVEAAGLPADLTPHGLRKAFVCWALREGWSTAQIMSYTGHGTAAEIDRYGREYQREQTAVAAARMELAKAG
jgi:integrase